ncbi:high-affinity choline uptake protein BetT [Vibrio ponticus]|nr:high-affinity choline uptake protein BetT [Vibrio ponticus]
MTKGIDKYSIDSTDYTIGQDNVQKWGFDVHNPSSASVLDSLRCS